MMSKLNNPKNMFEHKQELGCQQGFQYTPRNIMFLIKFSQSLNWPK